MASPERGEGFEAARSAMPPLEQGFATGDLYRVRAGVAAHASALGAAPRQVENVTIVASELATNAITHGGGGGWLRLWRDGDVLNLQIADDGSGLADPDAVGTTQPLPSMLGGRGMWIARELSDSLEIASGAEGTVVTARFAVQT